MWKQRDLTALIRERCCGSCTRFGRPLTRGRQWLQSYKLLFVFEVRLPTSNGPLFAEFAKTLLARGIICLSACLIALRFGEGNNVHHHGHLFQSVLDSRKLTCPASWLAKRFPFQFAAQCRRRRPWLQQAKQRRRPPPTKRSARILSGHFFSRIQPLSCDYSEAVPVRGSRRRVRIFACGKYEIGAAVTAAFAILDNDNSPRACWQWHTAGSVLVRSFCGRLPREANRSHLI
jgi:hypothetical protein